MPDQLQLQLRKGFFAEPDYALRAANKAKRELQGAQSPNTESEQLEQYLLLSFPLPKLIKSKGKQARYKVSDQCCAEEMEKIESTVESAESFMLG